MTTVTVKEMVRRYLINNGYDGLVLGDNECACILNSFMHCGGDCVTECVAGHFDGRGWHIKAGKKP